VVGLGCSDFGAVYRQRDQVRWSAESLGAAALRDALADAGLHKSDIDGLCIMRIPSYQQFGAMLGLAPGRLRHVSQYPGDTQMAGVAIQTAAMLVANGMAETVACVYGNNDRSAGASYEAGYESQTPWEAIYGTTSPGAMAALIYSSYATNYGVPEDGLAPLAISSRKFASNNPLAVMRDELTYDEYMGARYIAEPLRLFDYCLINDGAVAVILTTPERAEDLRQPPVGIEAMATSATLPGARQTPDDCRAPATEAADRLWANCGLSPADMDVASFCDTFAPMVLSTLEAFGYCRPGTAWEFVRDGRIDAGGELPLNTSGGHRAEGNMQGWNHIAELIRQLRGQSGNQVTDCQFAHYACYSSIVTSMIFTKAA
jgi:acetyl-CoA acetyltransferase